jgi:hypothetical protein
MYRGSVICVALLLVATACGDEPARTVTGGDSADQPEDERLASDIEYPPDVTVSGGGAKLDLQPYAFCWGNACADGIPPDPPPDIGSADELVVEFPEPGWTFTASFRRAGDPCARTQTAELEPLTKSTHRLVPHGAAGSYDVDLFGQGDGDLSVRLRWTTPADGPLPVPEAHLGVLADNDGVVDSYGVELSVTNLASSPDHATAVVTVAASGGEELSFEPTLTSLAPAGCDAVEGQVYWTGPDAKGKEAAALGDPPFTYTVELTLDGTAYVATATWPDDIIPDLEPYVSLAFDPPLPAPS